MHFDKAYQNILILDRELIDPGRISNTQEVSGDDDISITTITEVMSTMQMTSNMNTQSMNVGINVMR